MKEVFLRSVTKSFPLGVKVKSALGVVGGSANKKNRIKTSKRPKVKVFRNDGKK